MDEGFDDEILENMSPSRRRFIKGIVVSTAFAAPMVSSFDISTLSTSSAYAANGGLGSMSNGGFAR